MATREMPDPDELRKKYPSNSVAAKSNKKVEDKESSESEQPSKKDIRQVTTVKKVKKKSLIRRIGKSVLEDGIESAKEKAYNDIVVPGIKALLFDTVTDILDTMLFGGTDIGYRGSQKRSNMRKRSDRTSYSDYYERRSRGDYRGSEREEHVYEPDDIILDTRADARDVLDELDHIIRKYGQASVADFYDLIGITSDWTDNRYGWTSLNGASIKPVRDGFMLLMPRTHLLDD